MKLIQNMNSKYNNLFLYKQDMNIYKIYTIFSASEFISFKCFMCSFLIMSILDNRVWKKQEKKWIRIFCEKKKKHQNILSASSYSRLVRETWQGILRASLRHFQLVYSSRATDWTEDRCPAGTQWEDTDYFICSAIKSVT